MTPRLRHKQAMDFKALVYGPGPPLIVSARGNYYRQLPGCSALCGEVETQAILSAVAAIRVDIVSGHIRGRTSQPCLIVTPCQG